MAIGQELFNPSYQILYLPIQHLNDNVSYVPFYIVMAYMEFLGNASHNSGPLQEDTSFVRHSVHVFTQNSTKTQR
jgi:hypothetical protein